MKKIISKKIKTLEVKFVPETASFKALFRITVKQRGKKKPSHYRVTWVARDGLAIDLMKGSNDGVIEEYSVDSYYDSSIVSDLREYFLGMMSVEIVVGDSINDVAFNSFCLQNQAMCHQEVIAEYTRRFIDAIKG